VVANLFNTTPGYPLTQPRLLSYFLFITDSTTPPPLHSRPPSLTTFFLLIWRSKQGHRLADNFYVKQDGTRVYYFTTEGIRNLMRSGCNPATEDNEGGEGATTTVPVEGTCSDGSVGGGDGDGCSGSSGSGKFVGGGEAKRELVFGGLEEVELGYVRRQAANRLQQRARFRIWVHGKFRRPYVA